MARKTTKRPKAAARPKSAARRTPAAPKKVQAVPAGYHTVTPYLTVNDGAGALEFYKRAFGAREAERMPGPGGKLMHAELRIGDSVVMLSDEFPGMSTCKAPKSLGGTTGSIFLYLADVDPAFRKAVEAGCKVLMPLTNMFWGDRFGKLEDPFGNQWTMATHVEDVTPDEMRRRAADAMARMGQH
ncbi:MAG: glyoxalase [Candidatus Rokuibacteriota bacterium]|nr:MAG: glyoxalase [Candidatus Rokubacteria bacterium]